MQQLLGARRSLLAALLLAALVLTVQRAVVLLQPSGSSVSRRLLTGAAAQDGLSQHSADRQEAFQEQPLPISTLPGTLQPLLHDTDPPDDAHWPAHHAVADGGPRPGSISEHDSRASAQMALWESSDTGGSPVGPMSHATATQLASQPSGIMSAAGNGGAGSTPASAGGQCRYEFEAYQPSGYEQQWLRKVRQAVTFLLAERGN